MSESTFRPSTSQSVILTKRGSHKETMSPINIDDSNISQFIVSKSSLGEGGFGKVRKVSFELVEKHIEKSEDFEEERDIYLKMYKLIESSNYPPKYNKKIYNLFVNVFFYSSLNQKLYMEPLTIMDEVLSSKNSSFNGEIFKQMFLMTVAFNHFYGLSHQDFKPKNIGVDRTGRVKFIDFGLTVPLGKYSANRTTYYYPIHLLDKNSDMTKLYIFNIKICGKTYKASYFDLYSFGITLYDHLFHKHPFDYDRKKYTKSESSKKRMILDYKTKRNEFKSKLSKSSASPSYQSLFESLLLTEPGTTLNGDNIVKVFNDEPSS